MNWKVEFAQEFDEEFEMLSFPVKEQLAAVAKLLQLFGPHLGRPNVDTLKASVFANMKELRFDADDGAWRVAFAFDPQRKAILLVAGDKSGGSEKRFYRTLIAKADERIRSHLDRLAAKKGEKLWAVT